MIKFLLSIGFCLQGLANAQTYSLQSLDGAKVQIELTYKRSLRISCAGNTIHVADFWALDTVEILNNRFLQISYAKRAGSNEGLRYLLLLCVHHNKLIQAMHIRSFSEYDLRPHTYQLFQVKTHLSGSGGLRLDIHNENRSPGKPSTHDNRQLTLRFDPGLDVFYSGHEKTGVPVITIGAARYYYRNGEWDEE
ncbi:hypothetical protein [Dinghuibacter silviterrae]|uniref:Uncharacterized protein n=1 Tax=Dinghuibacter silviterrae TaxID=1539049 RepID=A0A4R8DRY2_9BACT|nr:hypothetical protein [Dinghuibacter silviterrae]TDX00994.1 hypothetical protein EDB95_2025 [Dinghuibacter silviterrae]